MEEVVYYIKLDKDFNKSLSLLEAFINFGKNKGFDTEPKWFTNFYHGNLEYLIEKDLKNYPNSNLVYYFHKHSSGSFHLNGWTYEDLKKQCEARNLEMIEWSSYDIILEISIF